MVTTIQLSENVKRALKRMKETKQTYEEVIIKLINEKEREKRKQKELLIEGCKEMAGDGLRITKEWGHTDAELDWEWNGEL